MDKTAIMIAGPILSAIGLYFRYKKRSIANWMNERRIDKKRNTMTTICNECGAKMKRREYKTGHRKGSSPLVCSNYPDCRNIKWY